jgi:hypothetical protein
MMSELIPVHEARKRLGISKTTMTKRLREWGIRTYSNPRDTREKLVDWGEVEAAFSPRPIQPEVEKTIAEGKAAA